MNKLNYRNTELSGKLSIRKTPAAEVGGEMSFLAGTWGITAVDGCESRRLVRISGRTVKEIVCHHCPFVREIEQVFDDKILGGHLLEMTLFRRELIHPSFIISSVEENRRLHWWLLKANYKERFLCSLRRKWWMSVRDRVQRWFAHEEADYGQRGGGFWWVKEGSICK